MDRGRAGAGPAPLGRAGAVAAVLLSLAVVAMALGFERGDAFWLDESWTGAIIAQPSWAAAFHQIYWDVNAPLYYLLIRLWSLGFGLSDWALRAPSLIAAAATPLLVAFAPAPGLTRGRRLAWAAVLAFWFPSLCYAAEARCYALLLLVATAQTLAFMRLMERPGTQRAAVWAGLAALAILVHYDALYLGAAQGVLYVAGRPRRALASWPAALVFLVPFGWLAIHWPRISEFARPGIAWYSRLRLSELPLIGNYLADGGGLMPPWLLAIGLSALALRFLPLPARPRPERTPGSPVAWAVGASVLSALVLVAMGFARPSFTFRYLTPSEPGLLLGLVWLGSALAGRRAAPITLSLLAAFYLGVSGWMLAHHSRMAPRRYNFERASAAIEAGRPERLVFLWDHPVDPILHPEQLAALGDFFLLRDGHPVPVDPIVLKPGQDPNTRLIAAARTPGSAVLWLYDRVVAGTAAIAHPPDAILHDPQLRCRAFGSVRFGVLACLPVR